jgi:hypothetical protein
VEGHRFGLGVSWHPEEGDDPRLLAALVAAAVPPTRRLVLVGSPRGGQAVNFDDGLPSAEPA